MDSARQADSGAPSRRGDDAGRPDGAVGALALYDLAGGLALAAASPYLALRALRRPAEMRERFGRRPAAGDAHVAGPGALWLHAASLGEVRGALPLVRALAERGAPLFVSTVTPAARAQAGELFAAGAHEVRHAPLDWRPLVRPVLRRVAPRALLICETEIWPALLSAARERDLPVAFVNARLTERGAARWGRARGLTRALLAQACVAAQSRADAERWKGLGAPAARIAVTGNTKYERPRGPLAAALRAELRAGWRSVVVFGSVRSGEAEAVAAALRACERLPGPALFVLAPRHRERAARIVAAAAGAVPRLIVRCTAGDALLPAVADAAAVSGPAPGPGGESLQALLHVDTLGELRQFYSVADAAFIGGTLCPIGGHNPFEAAEYGVPIFHGPWAANVAEVVEALAEQGGGFRVADGRALGHGISALLASERERARAAAGALRAADALGGAVERTLTALASGGVPVGGGRDAGPARST